MSCARTPRSVGRPRWTSPSTSSTACWTWDAQPTSASPDYLGAGVSAPTSPIRATCVDAPLGARRIVVLGAARRRVLTCVRPLLRRVSCRGPGWESADRVQIKAAYSRYGVAHWLSRPRLSTGAPYPSSDLLTPSTASRPCRRLGRRHDRSSIDPALGEKGPDHAGHLVGQRHPH